MSYRLREAQPEDLPQVLEVEEKSTPGLRYVEAVWDTFINDQEGDWSVQEFNGLVVGCGKYTVLPDGSAWLETLRITPEHQGKGLGKAFYRHWMRLSREKGVKTMRMYTGAGNIVSKTLAERFGFKHVGTFKGLKAHPGDLPPSNPQGFKQISDPQRAWGILKQLKAGWGEWLVLNRTFYKLSEPLTRWLTDKHMIWYDSHTSSTLVAGARFMEDTQLHLGLLSGDLESCVGYLNQLGRELGVESLHCLFPQEKTGVEETLISLGFTREPSKFIVMEKNLGSN